jgi:hypothetical protein
MGDQSWGEGNSPEVSWEQKCKVRKWIDSRKGNGAVVFVSLVIVLITEVT